MRDARVRGLAVAVALLFGLGAIGVATVDQRAASSRVGLEPSDLGESGRSGEPPSATATSGPPAGAAPAGPAVDSNEKAPLSGIPAPKPGTYRYTHTVKTTSEESSTTTTNEKTEEISRRIERVSESAGEIIDRRHTPSRVIFTGDDGSKSESSSYEERSWRPDGSFLRAEVSHFTETRSDGTKREHTDECKWEPDRQQLVFPLRVGAAWTWESSCTTSHDQGDVTTTNKGSGKVVGTRDLDIGGRRIATFVVELTATEDSSGDLGAQRGARFRNRSEQKTTSFFAPELGLAARIEAQQSSEASIEGPPGAGDPHRSTTHQSSTTQLLAADPA